MRLVLALGLSFSSAWSVAQEKTSAPLEGEDVSLAAADGWKIFARYLKPAADKPVVVLLHSLGRTREEWRPIAYPLGKWGYGYIALDMRGHGFSITEPSGSTTTYRNFRKTGMDNEFNKMTRDAEAAITYLSGQSIPEDRIILMGAGLGANIAIKTAASHPAVSMVAALTPTMNSRDVLTVNPMRAYGKRPILLVSASDEGRSFKEFLLINDIAQRTAGALKVTTVVQKKGSGGRLLDKTVIRKIFEWLRNPERPAEVVSSTAAAVSTGPASVPPGDEGLPLDIPEE